MTSAVTRARGVRCPGPLDRGCEAVLDITAHWCHICGRVFEGHQLYELYLAQIGEMPRG